MVPIVTIRADQVRVDVEGHDAVELPRGDWAGLASALGQIAASHPTAGKLVLSPHDDTPHQAVIAAMDAARADFPHQVLAGGAW